MIQWFDSELEVKAFFRWLNIPDEECVGWFDDLGGREFRQS